MIETIGAGTACLQLGLELLHSLGRRVQLMLEILSRSRDGFERRFEPLQLLGMPACLCAKLLLHGRQSTLSHKQLGRQLLLLVLTKAVGVL
jgi:hypothetical protein